MKKTILLLAICLTIAVSVSVMPAQKQIFMGVSYYTNENPNLLMILDGVKARAKELGVKVTMASCEFDNAKQMANIENFIQMGCNIIMINPNDSSAVAPAIRACNKAKIPVVMLDIDAKGGDRAAHVTSDNEAMGRYGGEYLAWKLNGKGKVALLDYPQLDIVKERSDAFKKVIHAFPDMQIVATDFTVVREDALQKVENILQAHPDLNAIYAINAGGGLGAYYACKAAGKTSILITAVDGLPEAVELIKKGDPQYVEDTSHMTMVLGRTATDTAYAVAQGKKVTYKTVVPVFPVCKESIGYFPGCDAPKLPPADKMAPPWYITQSWLALCDKYGYAGWKN